MALNKKMICSALFILSAILITVLLLICNKAITVREFTVYDEKLPKAFDGFRIVHVSDLHNESFGTDNEKLISEIKKLAPDAIAITGDIIDSRRTDADVSVAFVAKAVETAPVYYVTGNHEYRTSIPDKLIASLKSVGARVLCGEKITLEKDGGEISFYGIDDPRISGDYLTDYEAEVVKKELEELHRGEDFSILLSHRPEFFDIYKEFGYDLVLTGHAHGGQFRIPFAGGVYAPGQGFFPEFDSGLYEEDSATMIVSRGLGNSVIPLRINNNPELILITLKKEVR